MVPQGFVKTETNKTNICTLDSAFEFGILPHLCPGKRSRSKSTKSGPEESGKEGAMSGAILPFSTLQQNKRENDDADDRSGDAHEDEIGDAGARLLLASAPLLASRIHEAAVSRHGRVPPAVRSGGATKLRHRFHESLTASASASTTPADFDATSTYFLVNADETPKHAFIVGMTEVCRETRVSFYRLLLHALPVRGISLLVIILVISVSPFISISLFLSIITLTALFLFILSPRVPHRTTAFLLILASSTRAFPS